MRKGCKSCLGFMVGVVGVGMSACLLLGALALGGCAQPGCDPEARDVTHRCGAPESTSATATETGTETETDGATETDGGTTG